MDEKPVVKDCALPREEFLRLSVEDAISVLERYPNLRAMLQGCVSGHSSEWPMLRTELQILLYSVHTRVEEIKKAMQSEPPICGPHGCKLPCEYCAASPR